MSRVHLQLSESDRAQLQALVSQQNVARKVFQRAMALLELDAGQSLQQAGARAGLNYNTVALWRDRYKQEGALCLQDRPRSGRPIKFDGVQRAGITALACSTPPEGNARWSLRLLADKAVELELVEGICHSRVHAILKKTLSSPT